MKALRTIFYVLAIISMLIICIAFSVLFFYVVWNIVISILKWFWTAPILLAAFILWIGLMNRKKD